MESTAFTLELTDAEWDQVGDVIPETADLIRDAAGTLDLMATLLTNASADLHPPHCAAALRLAARGLRAAETAEFAALDVIDAKLRHARAGQLEARRAAEGTAEAERIVLAEARAKVAAISNPALRAAMTKLLEEEIIRADQP